MLDLTFEAEKQLNCLDARIAQLLSEYKHTQLAERRSLSAGAAGSAKSLRAESRMLIGNLSYLIRERCKAERA